MSDRNDPRDNDVSSVRLAAAERVTSVDPRAHAAWRTWLTALAHDPDAATAAALAYESLSADARDAWLDALDSDAPAVEVPKVALFAPLLAVETDDARRARIARNIEGAAKRSTPPRALVGVGKDGERVCIIVSPLYLEFVEILLCRYHPDEGMRDARHKWLAHKSEVAAAAKEIGVTMAETPLPQVVEDLAHAVVADRRAGRAPPPALARYIDLFAPDLEPDREPGPQGGDDGGEAG